MSVSRRFSAVAFVGSLAFMASCSSNTPTTSSLTSSPAVTQKVTVILDWTPNTNHSGIYLAKAKGFYKDAGLDVTIIEPGADGGLPQLEAGNAQFAITASESLLPARAQGAKVVSVAAILQHNTSSLIVPEDRGITSPKVLPEKRMVGLVEI